MKKEIKVPSMGESIQEAMIGQIIASTGTVVKTDGEILELETDKVNQVLYAPQGGKVTLTVKSGDTVKVGQTIGSIESVAEQTGQEKVSSQKKEPSTPSSKIATTGEAKNKESAKASSDKGIRYTRENYLSDLQSAPSPAKTSQASPHVDAKPVAKQEEASKEAKPSAERETRRPMSKIRKVIAQRLVEAQQTMAMLTTFNEVDMSPIMQLREKYKDSFAKKFGCKLGFMSFFVKAVVSALQAIPDFNSYLDGDEIVHREYYDIGVAVGTEKGVIVPVIRNCDQRSFAEIEQAIELYAKKAREGTLVASDLQGGGFTITNGGVYGSLLSTPILLPPQCGILGMHKIEKRPIVIDDQIEIRSMMYLALSYDHRLVDGKEAVTFLVHIKNMLEEPSRLILGI